MKLYVVEYASGGFSDNFTLGEIFEEIKKESTSRNYGGVKRWFPMTDEEVADVMKHGRRTDKPRRRYTLIESGGRE